MKYRIYDTEEKEYITVLWNDNHEWHYNIYLTQDGEPIFIDHMTGDSVAYEVDRYIIEFCSGLPDKNKHEYFEGDLFKVRGIIKVIKFVPEMAGFCMLNIDMIKTATVDNYAYIRPGWWKDFYDEIEYCGNIHDNPGIAEVGNE